MCLPCLCAHMPTCLVCQCALHGYVLTCQHALHTYVPCVLTCKHALYAYMLTCLVCLRVHMHIYNVCLTAHVLKLCAITSNNKNKFSMTCFTYTFHTFSLSFSWEIKLYMTSRNVSGNIYFENSIVHSGISLTRQKCLLGAMTNFVVKKK